MDYRATNVETLAEAGELFDVVLAMEVIEHTTDPDLFICELADITRGRARRALDLNRTARSVAPRHRRRRIHPRLAAARRRAPVAAFRAARATLARLLRRHGLRVIDTQGVVYRPHRDDFVTGRDLSVNS
ncbi:MAG: hypothetical protein R3D28_01440 [Geminicoccaceae bacterium]